MTEENTAPDTDETHHACANRQINEPHHTKSNCSYDGLPCDTEDCPHNSPHTGHNAPTPTCGDDDEACGEDPEPKDSPTPEEIMTAYNHLKELVKRADTHAICIISMDTGEMNAFRMEVSNNIKINDSVNEPTPGITWLSIMGHAQQINKSLAHSACAITEGLRHYIENRTVIAKILELSGMDTMFGGNTPTAH